VTAEASQSRVVNIIVIAEGEHRAAELRSRLAMVFPRALVTTADSQSLAESDLPEGDVALIEGGAVVRDPTDSLRLLRARGFGGPIVVVTPLPDDATLCAAIQSLGATSIARDDANPIALATALTAALDDDAALSAELLQARRVFAAGQAALSLQHGINNPLAALLAEAQLLQLEDLTNEQRASADRMVELCRRIVTLVRRLDALGDG
jgi:signal transduction histidine kinase